MVLPNQLTVLRIILTPVFLFFFLSDDNLFKQISVVIFIVAALTDWYDGWLARKFNYITTWGKFMDPLADKILTSTAFFAFALNDTVSLWMVIVIVSRDILVTLARLYADFREKTFITSYLAKVKTFLQMAFIYYLLLVYALQTYDYFKVNDYLITDYLLKDWVILVIMIIITTLTILTGLQYVFQNKAIFTWRKHEKA